MEAKYTEKQLRRAFECGTNAGLRYALDKSGTANGGWADMTELMDTPFWVHNTNMSLFVWQFISWTKVRDNWILRPERTDDLLEMKHGRFACDGDARDAWLATAATKGGE